jgi:hypothetical protein
MLTAQCKPDYCTEKLLKYSLNIMVVLLKGNVQWHLKYQKQCMEVTLLILNCKYAEETSNCTAAWKVIVTD